MANERKRISNKNSNTDGYLQRQIESAPLQKPVTLSAIRALKLLPGSSGLDVGCGYGAQAILLAEAVGPTGHVTGVDISQKFLDYGRDIVKSSGLLHCVSLEEGDMNTLPFDDNTFDWAWSASCVGYSPNDPLPALREMARVVKPGGRVIILVWSSETLLSGYPVLEAHLRATSAGIAPFSQGMKPESHYLRMLARFREIGLEERSVKVIPGEVNSPISIDLRKAMIGLLEMRWLGVESELSEGDWTEFKRLTQPGSPDFMVDQPDYYAFFSYSMFQGRVP